MDISIFEKQNRVLAKVGISGGGRCNLTNTFEGIKDLKKAYPRGDKLMKRLFMRFDYEDAFRWFENHGVKLTVQDDYCVFPQSQDSQSIIDCFLNEAQRLGIQIYTSHSVETITFLKDSENKFRLYFRNCNSPKDFDYVAVTTGGSPQKKGLDYLESLGHAIVDPVPSLFTFSLSQDKITGLMGTVVENAAVSIPGSNYKSSGPLLITHWGMSGPAILKLSSYAARYVHDCNYKFDMAVNWTGVNNHQTVADELSKIAADNPQKILMNVRPYNLPHRLWRFLLEKSGVSDDKKWCETGRKSINKLVETLCNDIYTVSGKGTFKDEFVTCGGIDLRSVDTNTLESKSCPGLFFAGEVLDVDAITGGFNFQAAWTTAFVAAGAIAQKVQSDKSA